MLIPDRLYKENRANWNANYQQPDKLQHSNANWPLPMWKESPSRMWNNQSNQSNQMRNLRKVSAKQHYLSVARYVAGQSTNLPSRYKKFQNIIERILITCATLIIGHLLVHSHIAQNIFSRYLIHPFELILCGNSYSQLERIYDMIIRELIRILTITTQYISVVLSRILFPLNIFLNVFDFIESSVYQISQIILNITDLPRFRRILLTHFIGCLVNYFAVIMNMLGQCIRTFVLYTMQMLRYISMIILLIIELSTACFLHTLDGSKCVFNGTIYQN